MRSFRSPAHGRFMVVGAGPAGLQAALTLAEAGTAVEILEREGEAGGQLRPASRPQDKRPLADWVAWACHRLAVLGAGLTLGRAAEEADWEAGGFDAVVLAAGSHPGVPQVAGAGPAAA